MASMNLPTARKQKKNKFDNSTTHVLTHDVGQLRPVNILPTIAGDTFDISFNSFSRLAPLVAPTFGSFRMKYFAFFVPYRLIWNGYKNFVRRSVDSSIDKKTIDLPVSSILNKMFGLYYDEDTHKIVRTSGDTEYSTHDVISSGSWDDVAHYDFGFAIEDNTLVGFNLTSKGRWFFNVLVSLGYELPHRLSLKSSSSVAISYFNNEVFSALPLLAFARTLYDYVYPSAYVDQQGFGYLFDTIQDDDPDTWLTSLMDLLFVPYDQDYFTSLWHSPNSVASGSGASAISATNVLNPASGTNLKLSSDENATLVYQNSASETSTLSAYALRWLQAASDFAIRNNIAGTRFTEWLKAHRGFATKEQKMAQSLFLKSWTNDLQISDVTALTGTDTQLLGEQAGKAVNQAGGSLKFNAPEDGFLIFVSMVVPRIGYYQGLKPWTHKITSPFDFYTEEFDSVGLEPIPMKDLYASYETYTSNSDSVVPLGNRNNVFGFAPRYSHMYKHGFDYLSGDFRLASRNTNLKSYHTFRDLESDRVYLNGSLQPIALDANFMSVGNQYNRIFASDPTDGEGNSIYDKILTICRFNVTRHSYMSSIGQSLPLFDKSGDSVKVDYEGTQLN